MRNLMRTRTVMLLLMMLIPVFMYSYAAAQPRTSAMAGTRVLIPLITNTPPSQSIFGVEVSAGAVGSTDTKLSEAHVAWTRYNGIDWAAIEPQRGAPDFSRLAQVDSELQALAARGARPIVIVRGTPAWAQQVPGSACGPIRADARADFARFMRQIVERYSAAPYNVRYWEIGNEPDIDPSLVPSDSVFGCWGNAADPYYGGGAYADMLKAIYPAIKAVEPASQVVLGGLLLDCDPAVGGNACRPANFLEGILRNGGAGAFDIIAYHGYTFWNPTIGQQDWDMTNLKWRQRGGSVLGKLAFIREVLTRYNVGKPIMLNEASLLCAQGDSCDAAIRPDQANYAVRLYTRSWANNLAATIWYTLDGPGWNSGSLLDGFQNPRPAYTTFKFMTSRLGNASFVGNISGDGYEGYAFRNGATTYRVYWTNSGTSVGLPLPAGTRAVYNMYGEPISYSGSIGFQPIFVEGDS